MNTWIRRAVQVGVLSAGLILAGAAAAHADDVDMTSVGNLGIVNGNQLYFPIQVPIDVCGNGVGVLGNGQGSCLGGATAIVDGHGSSGYKPGKHHRKAAPDTTENTAEDTAEAPPLVDVGVLSSNDLLTPPGLPLDLCDGSGVSAGDAHAACGFSGSGAAAGDTQSRTRKVAARNRDGVDMTSVGNVGLVDGNQLYFPIQVPIDLCGNGLGIVGNGQGTCRGGAKAKIDRHSAKRSPKRAPVARSSDEVDMTSVGNLGLANGNQLYFPIQVPIDLCGNGLGIVGNGQAACRGGATAKVGKHEEVDMTSTGNVGILNGNQAYFPIQVPIDVSGNGLGVLGDGQGTSRGGATAQV